MTKYYLANQMALKSKIGKQKTFATHLRRVQRVGFALPDAFEKISRGEATFFAKNGVFATYSYNRHGGGQVAGTA